MHTIKTILVDDEPRGLSSLQKLLEMHCPEVQVIATADNPSLAKEKIRQLGPQLLFLDIAMPEKNGFDLLNELPGMNFEVVFVTAHNHYMRQAFNFSAIDYLLKPVEDELLIDAVKRAVKRIRDKTGGSQMETLMHNIKTRHSLQKMKLCIPSLKGFQVVEIKDIVYCEASGNYTNFYFTGGSVTCTSKPIHEYEELLSECNFVRIHKSFLVNLEHVKEYIRGEGGSVILSNNQEIEVSRRKKDLLMTKMKEYYKL